MAPDTTDRRIDRRRFLGLAAGGVGLAAALAGWNLLRLSVSR